MFKAFINVATLVFMVAIDQGKAFFNRGQDKVKEFYLESGEIEISFEEMSGKIVTFTVKVGKKTFQITVYVLHEFEVVEKISVLNK